MVRTDKLVICVAPCGSFLTKEANPNMPIQPDEIAEEVYRFVSKIVKWLSRGVLFILGWSYFYQTSPP